MKTTIKAAIVAFIIGGVAVQMPPAVPVSYVSDLQNAGQYASSFSDGISSVDEAGVKGAKLVAGLVAFGFMAYIFITQKDETNG